MTLKQRTPTVQPDCCCVGGSISSSGRLSLFFFVGVTMAAVVQSPSMTVPVPPPIDSTSLLCPHGQLPFQCVRCIQRTTRQRRKPLCGGWTEPPFLLFSEGFRQGDGVVRQPVLNVQFVELDDQRVLEPARVPSASLRCKRRSPSSRRSPCHSRESTQVEKQFHEFTETVQTCLSAPPSAS